YYGYLPSYYINSPIGANFISAKNAREGFLHNPQLRWDRAYIANQDGAAYLLYDDTTDDKQFTIHTNGNLALFENLKADFGGTYKQLSSDNYAKIQDLLGADFYVDKDSFSDTRNDLYTSINKIEDDLFNYHYLMHAHSLEAFAQVKVDNKKWNGFLSTKYSQLEYQRKGLFQNERFLENSFGNSQAMVFKNYGLKAGFSYKISGRHFILTNAALLTRPPTLQNAFINPRENNLLVPGIQSETISAIDFNYLVRMPLLTGRLTGFYTRFQNTTDVNFFFVDSGIGSDFVQEVVTDLDKLHKGIELGLEYQLSPTVKITGVTALGKYVFASNPKVAIHFDTAGVKEDLINLEGNASLGVAKVKDYKLAQGPQKALALGLEYRDPKYWWAGVTANYLANNYINISTILRTPSFYIDPETGQPFANATVENVDRLLAQSPLDNFYVLNLVGGKSWLKKGKYVSVFASINNVFDAEFRTGGYEQSRNGNFGQLQQDDLGSTPSFAPKYWYGYGRTYFLNLAYSF
ncbi:MAG: TonB-dependent receptor, partial [Maribacter sp.]|nr:TonB-dependent receptor [Maribacter sp.]